MMLEDRYSYINELVAKIKTGNFQPLFELHEFYKPLILCSIRRCLNKEPKLVCHKEDLLSESIFVLQKLVEQYDPELTYFSYFLSTRLDINLLRYFIEKFLDKADLNEDNDFEDHGFDPFNKIEEAISIQEALNKLNEKQREAINLYFFENLDQEESALKLGISQSSFSKRLQRALANLKELLGEDFLQ